MTSSENILLSNFDTPNQAPPFDKVSEDDYLPAIEKGIELAKARIEDIKNNSATPDFENTILALETCDEELSQATSVFYNQLTCMGGDTLHALSEQIGPISAKFSSDVMLDKDLFERVKSVYDKRDTLNLNTEQSTLLEETYIGFARNGAQLPEDKQARLREISERMSVLGPGFMNNVSKSSEAFQLILNTAEEIAGLPESIVAAARHAAEEEGVDGKYLFTLDIPMYLPFMQYAENRKLREQYWLRFSSRAWKDEYDNSDIILEIVRLRAEKANLLGFNTFADFVLERRMAEGAQNVDTFINKLKSAYKSAAINDLDDLKSFAKKEGLEGDLKPWDIAYYAEKLKKERFDFTSEDVRPYFPLQNVLDGVFEHFGKLFNIRFQKNDDYPIWHEDVQSFDVYEKDSDKFLGSFYADFHPRKGKKDGAWKTSYRTQGLFKGKIERPIIAIVCNFTKPTPDKPSLLTHDEVLTLFHEMGHAVHGLLSDVTYQSLGGTNVKWDFVELPSQIQENWCYEKETLDMFARHYETGEPMPEELLNKMIRAKNFMAGWGGLRQTNFAAMDMAWHTADPNEITSVEDFEDEVTKETRLFERMGGPSSNAFAHIFAGGYAAGYYSYKWAEVLDADAFEYFKETGLYNRKTADKYKDEILTKGGSEHPSVLYKRFRGRDADPDSLFRREGLDLKSSKAA